MRFSPKTGPLAGIEFSCLQDIVQAEAAIAKVCKHPETRHVRVVTGNRSFNNGQQLIVGKLHTSDRCTYCHTDTNYTAKKIPALL